MGMGLGFAILAGFTIIGVLIQPRLHHVGRGLICFGSLILTAFVFDIAFFMVTERQAGTAITPGDIYALLSIVLISVSDVAIVVEELRIRQLEKIAKGNSQAPAPATNG